MTPILTRIGKGSAVAFTLILGATAAQSAELIVVCEDECFWCEAWKEDVASNYSKTLEGQAAPIRHADRTTSLEATIALESEILFTPTFLLVEDGQEIGRIEGYPGADFFWGELGGMLNSMIVEVKAEIDTSD